MNKAFGQSPKCNKEKTDSLNKAGLNVLFNLTFTLITLWKDFPVEASNTLYHPSIHISAYVSCDLEWGVFYTTMKQKHFVACNVFIGLVRQKGRKDSKEWLLFASQFKLSEFALIGACVCWVSLQLKVKAIKIKTTDK